MRIRMAHLRFEASSLTDAYICATAMSFSRRLLATCSRTVAFASVNSLLPS